MGRVKGSALSATCDADIRVIVTRQSVDSYIIKSNSVCMQGHLTNLHLPRSVEASVVEVHGEMNRELEF